MTCIHTYMAYMHTYTHTYILTSYIHTIIIITIIIAPCARNDNYAPNAPIIMIDTEGYIDKLLWLGRNMLSLHY